MRECRLKVKPFRSKKYLAWIKSLDCCMCGAPADDYHHIIGRGYGGMGTKAPDNMTMPLCRGDHSEMHNNPKLWDDQIHYIKSTIEEAQRQGIDYGGLILD